MICWHRLPTRGKEKKSMQACILYLLGSRDSAENGLGLLVVGVAAGAETGGRGGGKREPGG